MSCSLQSCNVVHVRVDKTYSVNLAKSEAPAFQTRHLTSSLWSFATMGRPAPYVCIHSEFFALQGFGSLLGSAFGDLEVYGGKIGVEESTVDINLCNWLITFVHLCLVVFGIFFLTKQKKALPRNMGEVGFLCAIASACGRSMFNKRFVHVHAILQNVFGITASWFRAAWFRAGLCVELGVDRLCTWKFYGSSSKPKIALPEILRFLEMQGTFLHHNLPLISTHPLCLVPGSSFPRRNASLCAACLDIAALRRTSARRFPKDHSSESWHDDGLWRYGQWATVSRFWKVSLCTPSDSHRRHQQRNSHSTQQNCNE